jgi:hypothetical protein
MTRLVEFSNPNRETNLTESLTNNVDAVQNQAKILRETLEATITGYEDYKRLKNEFPLEFVVDCLTSPSRSPKIAFIGHLLRDTAQNPTLLIHGIRYHEMAELEGKRKLGYPDDRLDESHENNPDYPILHQNAKRKEFQFYQKIGEEVLGVKLPFLALLFASAAASVDYGRPLPPYEAFCKGIAEEAKMGMIGYEEPFTVEDYQKAVELFRIGGNKCSGEKAVRILAQRYISGERHREIQPWELM